jgi:hypothetical protein
MNPLHTIKNLFRKRPKPDYDYELLVGMVLIVDSLGSCEQTTDLCRKAESQIYKILIRRKDLKRPTYEEAMEYAETVIK